LRQQSAALRTGAWKNVDAPPGVLAFTREHAPVRILCVFNLGPGAAQFELGAWANAKPLPCGLDAEIRQAILHVPPNGGALLQL
ncbi:MAG: alpha-glucosidase, partial [Hyphomonadaceae bacterium]